MIIYSKESTTLNKDSAIQKAKGALVMEKKKLDLSSIAKEAGKNTAALWDKAKENIVKAADQNNDGALDIKDFSVIADTISNAAKNTAAAVKENAEEKNRAFERKRLQPIFAEDLDDADFLLSKLIRITEIDKRRSESEVCSGSIGFISEQKDLKIINIFRDNKKICFSANSERSIFFQRFISKNIFFRCYFQKFF